MARPPKKTDGRTTRRVETPKTTKRKTASRETTSLDRAVGRESERLIKENTGLHDQINEMKDSVAFMSDALDRRKGEVERALETVGALTADNQRIRQECQDSRRAVGRLKSEVERLRTERDSYRGALAACEPEVERHLSERLDGPPTVATLPMVSHSDRDFEEVDRPHWFDL